MTNSDIYQESFDSTPHLNHSGGKKIINSVFPFAKT